MWRTGYAICSLIYMVWVGYLSLNNFDMVHREYRRVAKNMQPARVREIARQELVDQCRKDSITAAFSETSGPPPGTITEDPCLSWPEAVVAEREKIVNTRLVKEQLRVRQKLVWFYITFGFFFMILPPVFLYMVLSLFIWLVRNTKFVE